MSILVKWAGYTAAAAFFHKNIDFFAIITAMCGSFMYMCGIPKGGLIVRVAMAGYMLVKVIGGTV